MKNLKIGLLAVLLGSALMVMGCANKTQKGAVVGTATGAAIGGIAGKAAGNTALGAIIGATVGGTTGAIIGRQMDKQAEEIKTNIPDVEVIRVEEGIVVEFSNSVLFGFDESTLSNDAKRNLDKLVTVLNKYKDTDIVVQGHTDSSGSESYNQNLSEERANRVAVYLASKGIDPDRLATIGFGEMLPKYLNNTSEGRELNRRVEFTISANEEMVSKAEKQAGN